MRRVRLALLLTSLVMTAPLLSACADGFDLDKLDVFGLNEKKKLPGDRRALFPEGVPGVTQGVPPELMKGHQPTPEEAAAVAPAPVVQPEKPKPKPRVAKRAPTRVTVSPNGGQQQPAPQAAPQSWPGDQPQQQQPQQAPWPSAPPAGTFSR